MRFNFLKINNSLKNKFINKNSLIMTVNTSMTLDELKKILKEKKKEVKKDYEELREKEKMIKQYKKLTKVGEKIRKGKNI